MRGLMEDGMSGGDWQDVRGTPDDPNALRGKRVLIMGLGLLGGGVAAARYAVEQGAAEVVATDLRDEAVLAPSIAKLGGLPIRYVLGRHDMADFARADVVVRNPGVRRDSAYLAAARAAGARIEMELDWFFRACLGKIAGVTGTRGKTTTTLLLHHILRAAGQDPLHARRAPYRAAQPAPGNLHQPAAGPPQRLRLDGGVWRGEGQHLPLSGAG
jgi:UDP-N-acetylmuramoylalanine--D-glutamate ligase